MSVVVEVFTPLYTKSAGFPEMEACVAALPLCEMTGADEIRVRLEGEIHGRLYKVEDVKLQLMGQSWLKAVQGLGNVAPEHGWNWVPGRHLLTDREVVEKHGGLVLPEESLARFAS